MKKWWTYVLLAVLVVLAAALLIKRQAATEEGTAMVMADEWSQWDGTVVFLGDSITDLCDLRTYYPGLNAVNRGISGDTTGGILDRLEQSVLDLAPDVVVLQGGINDLFMGYDEDEVVENFQAMIRAVRAALPEAGVVVQSLYPVAESRDGPVNGAVRRVNARLKTLAEDNGCRYADVYSALVTEDGTLKNGYADDGLHPNDAGYRVVAPVVSAALAEVIGELQTE